MSATEILVDKISGQVIDEDDPNAIHRVLEGDFVGRDSSGSPTAGQNLGTAIVPWGLAQVTDLIVDGSPIDPGLIAAPPNRVVSGKGRSTSDFPDYLRADGSSASFTILGASTFLTIDVNGALSQFVTDEVKSGLTTAPSSNNTCLINDTALTGQDGTRFLGENKTEITVDAMGSELTSKIGEFVAILNQATNEIIYCKIKSSTKLDMERRGFFFDSSGNPIEAGVLNNNDTLQLLSLGFVFAEDDGVSLDVTYRNPMRGGTEPSSPQTGDYWYDMSVNVWKRYGGATFDQIDRTFIGAVAVDTTNCIGARPEYFSKSYKVDNSLITGLESVDVAQAKADGVLISINGVDRRFCFNCLRWDAATDFESGVSRTVSRDYWLYLTEEGLPIISNKKPYDVRGFLRGWYHPYNSWRAVGQVFNNSADEFEMVNETDETLELLDGISFLNERIILSNNVASPTDTIDFSRGSFSFDDETSRQKYTAEAYSKDLTGTWVHGDGPGLDTGTVSANAWYYCYAIFNPTIAHYDPATREYTKGASDYIFTATLGSPTLPAGYTKKRFIGAIYLISSVIEPFRQVDKYFYWETEFESFTASVGTTAQTVTLDTPLGLEVLALVNGYSIVTGIPTVLPFYNKLVRVFPTSFTDDAVTGYNCQFTSGLNFYNVLGNKWWYGSGASSFEVLADISSQVSIRSNDGEGNITNVGTRGWIDINLED